MSEGRLVRCISFASHGIGTLKLIRHPDQADYVCVKFELRRLLDELRGRSVETHLVVKESEKYWNRVFKLLGEGSEHAIIPSAKSWCAKHKTFPPPVVLEEFQIEAWATFCVIAHQACMARKAEAR